jgi:mono/diheme cytochrome c family protein
LASTIYDDESGDGESLEGRFLVQDVREGLPPRWGAEVRRLRILAALPKTQPHMNTPPLGILREDIGRFVLGTVPVAEDGSAYFRVPSGVPLYFQALDARGRAVQTMRTLTYLQPGETLSCVGCHESRDRTPGASRPPLAASGPPSKIAAGPEGSWPLDFAALVQPVLDKHCVSCHRPGADGAAFDLTAEKSYDTWLAQASGALREQVLTPYRQGYSTAGMTPSLDSPVLALLDAGHHDVRLDADDYDRLVTWLDAGGPRQGSFSPEQEQALRKLRDELRPLVERP